MLPLTRSRWNLLLAATLLLGGLFTAATRVRPDAQPAVSGPGAAAPGATAPRQNHFTPDVTLTAVDGAEVRLSEPRGQVVLINVWATWCGPCRAEMPMIQADYSQYRERGFAVFAVNQREEVGGVAAYMREG